MTSFSWGSWSALVVVTAIIWLGVFCTLLPVIPGTLVTWMGVLVHRLWMGADNSVPWWFVIVGVGVVVLSQAMDYVATVIGVKRFGTSWKSGLAAILGGIVGMYFGPLGMFLGSVLLAMVFEFIEVRDKARAIKAGVGTVVANLLSMFSRLAITTAYAVCFYLMLPRYPWSL